MGIVSLVVLGIIVVAVVYGVMIYNGLVQVKHAVSKAWATIAVLLNQRHDRPRARARTSRRWARPRVRCAWA